MSEQADEATMGGWLRRRRHEPGAAFLDGRDGAALGWSDLAAAASCWASLAERRGVAPGSRVALVVADPLAFVAAWFGVVANGLCVVPLDPRAPAPELAASLRRARARVVATDRPIEGPELGAGTPFEWWLVERREPALAAPAGEPALVTSPIGIAALLMSSGTTGEPKGIPLTRSRLAAAAERIASHHRLTPADRGYSPLPLFHVNAQVVGLLTTLASGASLVVDASFDASRYFEVVAGLQPTWLNTVPAVLGALVRTPVPDLAALRRVRFARSASSALPLETLRRFEELTGVGVLETYGMTEAASQVTANPLEPSARRPGSVGLPVGLELRVVTGGESPAGGAEPVEARPAVPGEVGTVQLRGAAVVSHYLVERDGAEMLVAARDGDGWLSTGDCGRLDDDGYLWLLGRTDDVINRGGEKFHPREVEELLAGEPGVRLAAVVPKGHPRLGQVPVAFVELERAADAAGQLGAAGASLGGAGGGAEAAELGPGADAAALVARLERACAASLSAIKWPVRIEVLDRLPVGASGKVLRRELRRLAGPDPGTAG